MREQLEGSQAVARAVARCRPEVVCAYPITPQTHIVEALSRLARTGELAPCEVVNVESEFAAMSVAIGASATGARAYTATASQGLLYMAEALFNASGLGLPIVMTVANRAIGAPINIWNDHSDSMAMRDCGWIQLYASDNQEAVDLHVQAFRIAEELSAPVMVCMDGFVLTHAFEPLEVPDQERVDAFLPPLAPQQLLDPDEPMTIGAMVGPEAFTEVRYLAHAKQIEALDLIPAVADEFRERFGRASGGLLDTYRCADAETVVLALGSVLGTISVVVDELRDQDCAVGAVALKSFRPFPLQELRAALSHARRVVVLERALAVGIGGIVSDNVHTALAGLPVRDPHRHRRARRAGHHPALAARPARSGPRRRSRRTALPRSPHGRRRARARPRRRRSARSGGRPPGPACREHPARSRRRRRGAGVNLRTLPDGNARGGRPPAAGERSLGAGRPAARRTRSRRAIAPARAAARCSARATRSTPRVRASGGRLIAANATGCLEVFSTPYPESSWRIPWIHSLFANAPAVATGVAAALRAKGRTDVRVVGQGGDGGTVDIGFACLSGMFERGDDVLYICYDNEGYMNTGVQRSGATPPAARTATTEPLGGHPGNDFGQGKSAPLIAMAHEIPYVATATVAELRDLEAKVTRAMEFHGPRYLHVLVPCPLGWGSVPGETIEIARLAKESGLFPVFEAVNGRIISVSRIRRRVPVEEYLRRQKRFAHLFAGDGRPDVVARLQALADRNVERYGLLAGADEAQREIGLLDALAAAERGPA